MAVTYFYYVVSYLKGKQKHTIQVRATDKRRAKLLARRKLGPEVKILVAFKRVEHQKRFAGSLPAAQPSL